MQFQGMVMTSGGNLIATIDCQVYQVTREHPMYNRLFEAYRNMDADEFVKWYDTQQSLDNYVNTSPVAVSAGLVVSDDGCVTYNGVPLQNVVVDTIRNMMRAGLDVAPMVQFLQRAIQSNSKRVVDELFKFIEACGLTITPDGCFLAYKTVRQDWYDKYSGKFLNTVGSEHRVDKWLVDDNCNNTCSHGFHVGALGYAGPGGWYNNSDDRVLIVKVAPEDVVSVPVDHSCQKLRTCAYTVVGEFKGELKRTVYSGKVGDDYGKSVEPKPVRIELDPEDMVVDGMYEAWYDGANGHSAMRYFVVLEVHTSYVLVELMDPEENAGETRRFNFDRLSYVKEWDGLPPDDEDDDYYDEDEDEDEDDDCDCDCDCGKRYW